MSPKEFALEAIAQLPAQCTLDEIVEHLRFLAGIQEGFDQLDRGEVVPHEKVMKEIASWVSA